MGQYKQKVCQIDYLDRLFIIILLVDKANVRNTFELNFLFLDIN